jgi:hypothetical protein
MHRWSWNDIACVDDECLNANPADSSCDVQTRAQGSEHSEEGIHRHCDDEEHEQVDEELTRSSRKIGEEVNDDIETSDLDEHNGDISSELC